MAIPDAQQINGKSEPKAVRKSPQPAAARANSPAVPSPGKVKQEREDTPPPNEDIVDASKSGPCYCRSCDISFSYFTTFIAHKKYYCSSHAGEASNNNNNNNNSGTAAAPTAAPPVAAPATTPPSARTEASVL